MVARKLPERAPLCYGRLAFATSTRLVPGVASGNPSERMLRILVFLVFALFAAPAFAGDPNTATLNLTATLGGGAPLEAGVKWRIFDAHAGVDGSHALVIETALPHPMATLPAGDYVVHAAFGLASAMKRVTIAAGDSFTETIPIAAGALRIAATRNDAPIDPNNISLAIYVPERNNAEAHLVYSRARLGEVIGVPEGAYHIVSTYLDTVGVGALDAPKTANGATAPTPSNSVASGDVRVAAGKIVDVTLHHRFAKVTIKLVGAPGGVALANTTFTVLTPGGDIVSELIGAFPSLVLAEGDYIVIARHDAKTYQSTFPVKSGLDREVEIIAKDNGEQG
ncbi:MAG: hypothetical protein ACLPN5_07570 [Roseiarcus sp.]